MANGFTIKVFGDDERVVNVFKDKVVIATTVFDDDSGFIVVTMPIGKDGEDVIRKAGSMSSAYNWIWDMAKKHYGAEPKDVSPKAHSIGVGKKGSPTKNTKSIMCFDCNVKIGKDHKCPKCGKVVGKEPKPKKTKVCPVCNDEYLGRNKTCSAECATKRSVQASADAAKQMKEKKGDYYDKWKAACGKAAAK